MTMQFVLALTLTHAHVVHHVVLALAGGRKPLENLMLLMKYVVSQKFWQKEGVSLPVPLPRGRLGRFLLTLGTRHFVLIFADF